MMAIADVSNNAPTQLTLTMFQVCALTWLLTVLSNAHIHGLTAAQATQPTQTTDGLTIITRAAPISAQPLLGTPTETT